MCKRCGAGGPLQPAILFYSLNILRREPPLEATRQCERCAWKQRIRYAACGLGVMIVLGVIALLLVVEFASPEAAP